MLHYQFIQLLRQRQQRAHKLQQQQQRRQQQQQRQQPHRHPHCQQLQQQNQTQRQGHIIISQSEVYLNNSEKLKKKSLLKIWYEYFFILIP